MVLHLGNGASLCATHGGHSVTNTTGCSTVDGLPMGTRSGNLDPATNAAGGPRISTATAGFRLVSSRPTKS